jgi:carboxyl-terminal processing protease
MENLVCPPLAERLYGLSLIWQEANYNFAYFDHLPELDWGAAYREYLPRVMAAEDLYTYYDLLERFAALLQDGHSGVIPPKTLFESLDRPKLTLMNIENQAVVTNASLAIGRRAPIGSTLLGIDGRQAEEYLATTVLPVVCETTPHRRRDHAVARLLLGRAGSIVRCKFATPGGESVDLDLTRNRGVDPEPWLRPSGAPFRSEFRYVDEFVYQGVALPAFEFKILERGVGYVALNSFIDPEMATAFEDALPTLKGCSGLILDLRRNHGGVDSNGYRIVSHFLHQPTETCLVRTKKHIALNKANGAFLKDTPPDHVVELSEEERANWLCYRNRWFDEQSWGQVQPADETLSLPTAILTSSETGSAAEDFLVAFETGKGEGVRIGGSTSGSSGQNLIEDLPGGGMLGICTVRMDWQEEAWQTGIEPHIRVEPTVQDIIRDDDRALDTAVRYLCGSLFPVAP